MALILWQGLEREKMLKDHTARLEQIVRETLLTISRLLNTVAARIAESGVKPASNHQISQHVYLVASELHLATRLFLGRLTGLFRVDRVGHRFTLHH